MILVVKIRLHRKVTSWKHSQLMFNYVLIYHVSLEIARQQQSRVAVVSLCDTTYVLQTISRSHIKVQLH